MAKQFTNRFADRFVKVGKVRYDDSSDLYHVDIFYMEKDQEKRYTIEFKRTTDANRPKLVIYRGEFPTILFADETIAHAKYFTVTIDEMMNEEHDSQQPPGT